jgi:hypothetical protein
MNTEENKYEVTGENGKKPSVWEYIRMRGEYQYPTTDINVYAEAIAKMNLGDLQTHAMDKGIKPSPDRRRLEVMLLNQFKATLARRKANKQTRKLDFDEKQRLEEQRKKSIERAGFLRTRF